jgi:hypothetical protein
MSAEEEESAVNTKTYANVDDIFGDSDSDDDIRGAGGGGNDDDAFGSDDDGASSKKKRLSKGNDKSKKLKSSKKEKSSGDKGDLKIKKKKKDKGEKKRKNSEGGEYDGSSSSKSKRAKTNDGADKGEDYSEYRDEGGEYDSDKEVIRTADDENFLEDDDDDLLAGVVKEYGQDNENFDDEAPHPSSKSKGGKKGPRTNADGSLYVNPKATDVFSQTLQSMKKKKVAALTDVDKKKIAEEFLKVMDTANKNDDIAFLSKPPLPAMNKLNLLKKVQDMVSVKDMQDTLLDYDILGVLSDWILPKKDNTLPSHTIRTAVYNMLYILPAHSDHLKRKQGESQRTIGRTVMDIFRHKSETKENKLLLKKIIEKWSRPIFSKASDARSADKASNEELQHVVQSQLNVRMQSALNNEKHNNFNDVINKNNNNNVNSDAYAGSRARCPHSGGFLYTVKPESKKIIDYQTITSHDDGRKGLLKKMNDMKNANRSGFGKKDNTRSDDMQSTGRNKA